jgi:hypothetical protein
LLFLALAIFFSAFSISASAFFIAVDTWLIWVSLALFASCSNRAVAAANLALAIFLAFCAASIFVDILSTYIIYYPR